MSHKLISVMFVAAMFVCGPEAVRADLTWNAFDEFNSTSNTVNDTWQYLYAEGDGSNNTGYVPFSQYSAGVPDDLPAWRNDVPENWHFIGKDVNIDPLGLLVHPFGPPAYIAAIGWKSPIAGVVNAELSVTDLNVAEGDGQDWKLFKSGGATALSSGTILNGGTSGIITVSNISVASGDMLYLQINAGTTMAGDMTGVTFTVSSVPEPSAITLLVCGLFGLLAYAWRKRRD